MYRHGSPILDEDNRLRESPHHPDSSHHHHEPPSNPFSQHHQDHPKHHHPPHHPDPSHHSDSPCHHHYHHPFIHNDLVERSVAEESMDGRIDYRFRAGSPFPGDEELSGLRGRKGHALLLLVFFLLAMIVVELVLTFVLISALKLTPGAGFPAFLIEDDNRSSASRFVSVPLPVTVQRLIFRAHLLSPPLSSSSLRIPTPSSPLPSRVLSFVGEELKLRADRSVTLRVAADSPSRPSSDDEEKCSAGISLGGGDDETSTVVFVADSFSRRRDGVTDDDDEFSKRRFFCLGECDDDDVAEKHRRLGANFRLPPSVTSVSVSRISSSRFLSLVDEPLEVKSSSAEGVVSIAGNEGVGLETGGPLRLAAEQRDADARIRVKRKRGGKRFVGGDLKLKAEKIFVNKTRIRKNANWSTSSRPSTSSSSSFTPSLGYKICVCANGRLFGVAVRGGNSSVSLGCFHLGKTNNPCSTR